MKRSFFYLIMVLSLNLAISAQTGGIGSGSGQSSASTGKIDWKIYKIGSQKISVLLPKLPIVINDNDSCREISRLSYYAYADDVVYSIAVTAKAKEKPPKYCEKKENFSTETFNQRIDEIKQTAALDEATKSDSQNREIMVLHSSTQDYRIYNDLKNNRWIELSVIHRLNKKIDAPDFVNSLDFDSQKIGVEIGDGSPITIGDGISTNNPAPNPGNQETTAESLVIAAKPRPGYTDEARRNNVQGVVVLRVTFNADGGIGSISPVTGLPSGLTEQAIAATKKMVFLPAKRKGISVSVTKQIQYGFSIY